MRLLMKPQREEWQSVETDLATLIEHVRHGNEKQERFESYCKSMFENILTQTTKTNGRVSVLELFRAKATGMVIGASSLISIAIHFASKLIK